MDFPTGACRLRAAFAAFLAAGGLLAGPPALAQAPAAALASQLVGHGVYDGGGREIGRIEDILVDMGTGRATGAVLAVGGYVGIDGRRVVYPLPAKEAAARPEGGLVLQATPEKLLAMRQLGPLEPAAAPGERLASALRDSDILERGTSGRDIGDVKDLMVDLADGAVSWVVAFDPAWHRSESWVALPAQSLALQDRAFVARFGAEDIRPADAKAAQEAQPPAPPPLDPEARLTQLLGATVQDASGRALGTLEDVVIDPRERRVTQLVLRAAAGAGAPGRLVALDAPAAGARLEERRLVVDADLLQPQGLPDFRAEPARGAAGSQPARVRGTALLDARIADPSGENVGEVDDAVVNLRTGGVHFAVAEFSPNWVQAGMLVAVPLRPPRLLDEPGKLAMQFGLNELNRAYFFEKKKWPDLNDRAVRAQIDGYVNR